MENNMDPLSRLLHVNVSADGFSALLNVPDPGDGSVDIPRAEDAIVHLFRLLGAIVHRDPDSGVNDGGEQISTEASNWPEAYRKVVAFIVWLLGDEQFRDEFLFSDEEGDAPYAVKLMQFIGSPEEAGLARIVQLERALIFAFILGLHMARTLALPTGLAPILPLRPELIIFDMISSLSLDSTELPGAYCRAGSAMAKLLSSAAGNYGRNGDERERVRLQATANSLLHVHELPFLAARVPHTLKKYGPKKVEKRFEQQLNLALQWLGFRTIPTTPGARTGDIICITSKQSPPAVLVEAKTSAHPYRLPTDDERALLEYAQKLREESWFPYPLKLICIFGPEPDGSLRERLRGLEIEAGVPVRYCTAGAFVALLLSPPAGTTADDLVGHLLHADQIVSKEYLLSVSSAAVENLKNLRRLVNASLRPN